MATDEATSRTTDVSPVRPPTPAEQRAKEHAGTTDTDVLVSDIAKTREELAVTIDAIVDRVSPKKVVERGKQQARENVEEAKGLLKGHAATAAGVAREKAQTASEVVKEKAAQVKGKVSGTSDSTPPRSPLAPATSVSVDAAAPATTPATVVAPPASSPSPSPLPANTVSVDAGQVPPPEPVDSTGALAEAADARAATIEPAGSELPPYRPGKTSSGSDVPPAYAGAGAAALVALVLLLLRRRRSKSRRRSVVRR